MGSTKLKKIEEEVVVDAPTAEVVEESEETPVVQEEGEAKPKAKKSESKKKPKKGAARVRSKKYQAVAELVERTKLYPLAEAIELSKKVSFSKFQGSLEVHIDTRVKNLRGLVTLPHLSGKQLKILAFGTNAKEAGADMVGDDAKLALIEKGKIDFDVLVATPAWMPKLARSAKVLGPRGLMPNPKNGTVTENLEKAITELKSGKVEYKTESNLTAMHLRIGSLSQPAEELTANLKTLFAALGKSKVRRMSLSPTMGPAIKVDPISLQ